MKKHQIVSIGEVLWDLLPAGRILGGAPANFALHTHGLGATVQLISRVGSDDLGREIFERLAEKGFDAGLVGVDENLPTGTVAVTLSSAGHPSYVIHEDVAWDAIQVTPDYVRAVESADAVCFGSLAQRSGRSRQAVQSLLQASRPNALRVFDVNLRQSFYTREVLVESLGLANCLKLNEDELPVLSKLFGLEGDLETKLRALALQFQLRVIAYTRGGDGSCLLVDGEWSEHEGVPVVVLDTVGAGDSFTAALVLGLLSKWPLKEIHSRASEVAAFVCSHAGPTPLLPSRFSISPDLH